MSYALEDTSGEAMAPVKGESAGAPPAIGAPKPYRITRSGARPLRFAGSELVMAMSFTPELPYWYEINMYRTSDLEFVAAVRLFHQSEDMPDTVEEMKIPRDVLAICVGKSTYARCGIIANLTPAEAGWRGYLTLEFSNSSSADCRIYANEGVVQLLFLEGDPCQVSYETRRGKYQDQAEKVTLAKV